MLNFRHCFDVYVEINLHALEMFKFPLNGMPIELLIHTISETFLTPKFNKSVLSLRH